MVLENTVYVVGPDEDMSRSLAALLGTYDIHVKRFVDVQSFCSPLSPKLRTTAAFCSS